MSRYTHNVIIDRDSYVFYRLAGKTSLNEELLRIDGNGNFVFNGTATVSGTSLVALTDGSEVGDTLHTHNDIYFTEIELSSTISGTSGGDLIGVYNEFSNSFGNDVQTVLDDLDSAITTIASGIVASGTIVDHGLLIGLNDDDHLLYLTEDRGDVRYFTQSILLAGELDSLYYRESEVDALIASGITTHSASANHDGRYYTKTLLDGGQLDNRYYTETEIDTALDLKADKVLFAVSGNFAGLNASGNLTDSGYDASDFATLLHTHTSTNITDFQTAVSANSDVAASAAARHTHLNGAELALITDGDHDVRIDNPHGVTATQIGLGNVLNLKMNLTATTNPTSTDDINAGYSVGSRWININTNEEYVCTFNAASAANWEHTTGDGGGAVASGIVYDVAWKTVSFTPDIDEQVLLVTPSTSNISVNLPSATVQEGKYYYIKKTAISLYNVVITASGSETIDLVSSLTLSGNGDSIHIISDGSNWYII